MRKQKRTRPPRHTFPFPAGVELRIEYKGPVDVAKDSRICRILTTHSTGSGYLFIGRGVRDYSATVPLVKLAAVVKRLRKLRGVRVQKLVQKWVTIR